MPGFIVFNKRPPDNPVSPVLGIHPKGEKSVLRNTGSAFLAVLVTIAKKTKAV